MNAIIHTGETENNGFTFWYVKDCPHIEVSIKCPHMIAKRERQDQIFLQSQYLTMIQEELIDALMYLEWLKEILKGDTENGTET